MPQADNYVESIEKVLERNFDAQGDLTKGIKLGFILEEETVSEARRMLASIRQAQKELRQIKREINAEMKGIRAAYRKKASNAQPGFISGLRGKGAQRSDVADQKRALRQERDRVLGPYESLKLSIDDLLVQLDHAKLKIDDWIREQETGSTEQREALSDQDGDDAHELESGPQASEPETPSLLGRAIKWGCITVVTLFAALVVLVILLPPQEGADTPSAEPTEEPSVASVARTAIVATRETRPTLTPRPTKTSAPTATPLPNAVVTAQALNFRRGPGVDYQVIDTLTQGDNVTVMGRNSDGSWLFVELQDGSKGWASTQYLGLEADLDKIAVQALEPPSAQDTALYEYGCKLPLPELAETFALVGESADILTIEQWRAIAVILDTHADKISAIQEPEEIDGHSDLAWNLRQMSMSIRDLANAMESGNKELMEVWLNEIVSYWNRVNESLDTIRASLPDDFHYDTMCQ